MPFCFTRTQWARPQRSALGHVIEDIDKEPLADASWLHRYVENGG
jgi:hypothetical protein